MIKLANLLREHKFYEIEVTANKVDKNMGTPGHSRTPKKQDKVFINTRRSASNYDAISQDTRSSQRKLFDNTQKKIHQSKKQKSQDKKVTFDTKKFDRHERKSKRYEKISNATESECTWNPSSEFDNSERGHFQFGRKNPEFQRIESY